MRINKANSSFKIMLLKLEDAYRIKETKVILERLYDII